MKQKVGILTFHFADNYGAGLQTYATYSFLKKNNISCEIINYAPQMLLDTYDTNPFKTKGIDFIRTILKYPNLKKQHKLFEEFRKDYLGLTCKPKTNFIEACKEITCAVVGSDQVWNATIIDNDKSYFLAELSGVKKIGYAISVGEYNNKNTSKLIKKYAKDFNSISMREKKAIEYCHDISGVMAQNVVDPIFLLEADDWREIECKPLGFNHEKYILLYILERNNSLHEQLLELSKKNNIPIISIHPKCSRFVHKNVIHLNGIGPREFIWLIRHAEFVATNSFHGTVFSSVFKKRILFAAHKTLGDRNQNLMALFNCTDLSDGGLFDFDNVDWKNINNLKEDSVNFLLNAIQE